MSKMFSWKQRGKKNPIFIMYHSKKKKIFSTVSDYYSCNVVMTSGVSSTVIGCLQAPVPHLSNDQSPAAVRRLI